MNKRALALITRNLPDDASDIIIKDRRGFALFFTSSLIDNAIWQRRNVAIKPVPMPKCYDGAGRYEITAKHWSIKEKRK